MCPRRTEPRPGPHLKDNLAESAPLIRTMCPARLEQPGIGPVTAAIALTAWSHHGRVRSEAAFAALAGVSHPCHPSANQPPSPQRRRDRTPNAAIHTIAKSRPAVPPADQGLHQPPHHRRPHPIQDHLQPQTLHSLPNLANHPGHPLTPASTDLQRQRHPRSTHSSLRRTFPPSVARWICSIAPRRSLDVRAGPGAALMSC